MTAIDALAALYRDFNAKANDRLLHEHARIAYRRCADAVLAAHNEQMKGSETCLGENQLLLPPLSERLSSVPSRSA